MKHEFDVTNSLFSETEENRPWTFFEKVFSVVWQFFAAIGMTFFVLFLSGYLIETWK